MNKSSTNLAEIVELLGLTARTGKTLLKRAVTGGIVSDMLSDVMANGRKGDIWITLQVHPNIIAVAVLKELAGIITVNGREPESETIRRGEAENVPLLTSELSAFELVGKLYEMGIRGCA